MQREIPIERLAQVVGAEIEQTIRAVKLALFRGVIMDTRVDTGRLRGNWQTSTGAPAEGEVERIDPAGSQASQEAEAGVQAYTVDYLTNNLPYAEVWEERDGMISRAVARIDRNIRERTRER